MCFKVGDKVVISRDSEYYGVDPNWNPADVIGTIVEINRDCPSMHYYSVDWGNECFNTYREEDLVDITKKVTWRGSKLKFSFV